MRCSNSKLIQDIDKTSEITIQDHVLGQLSLLGFLNRSLRPVSDKP